MAFAQRVLRPPDHVKRIGIVSGELAQIARACGDELQRPAGKPIPLNIDGRPGYFLEPADPSPVASS